MLTDNEMTAIAEKYISDTCKDLQFEVVLLTAYTIKKSYGNIYVYNSKKYIETDDYRYCLLGNAPFLVENKTGNIVVFGTSHQKNYYIQEYEAGRWVSIQKK
jgi:hypothetical protein